jgi:hypothetical protein
MRSVASIPLLALPRRRWMLALTATGFCRFQARTRSRMRWVTWGALQQSTLPWTAAALEEIWVIITEEDAKAASLDIDALHGTGGS